jgi:uncharacterized UBP type Zn finger protein
MYLLNIEYHSEAYTIVVLHFYVSIVQKHSQFGAAKDKHSMLFSSFSLFLLKKIEGDAFSSEFPHDAAGCYCLVCLVWDECGVSV